MEIWTRQREQLGWTPWPDVARGLASLLHEPDAQILLLSDAPDVEHDLLVAAVRLVRALAGKGGTVVVASPFPSVDLIESLRPVDVDQIWVVERPQTRRGATLENVVELGHDVCPHLHTQTADGTTLAVCGCHDDRMVLARHHLDRWCLPDNRDCPQRRGVDTVD